MRFPACLSCFSGKRPGATADAGPASGGHARSADLTRVARGQQRRHQPSGLAPRGARAAGTAGKEGPCPADTAAGGGHLPRAKTQRHLSPPTGPPARGGGGGRRKARPSLRCWRATSRQERAAASPRGGCAAGARRGGLEACKRLLGCHPPTRVKSQKERECLVFRGCPVTG